MSGPHCLGIFREQAHSPGRESDDAEILRLTAKHLEAAGFQVVLKSPEEVTSDLDAPLRFVFLMCERVDVLKRLAAWEANGIPHVNTPAAVLNTYRERMIAQFQEARVPFVPSRVVPTDHPSAARLPVWVKRSDVHNTQDGDVVFVDSRAALESALGGLLSRGIPRALLQPHVPGDLIKFYGVGSGGGPHRESPWFRWFYHKDQVLAHHAFDARRLARLARQAALALGLEIYGGDAIATASGDLVLLDVNAWPSFALYRDEAAVRIAAHLRLRFSRGLA